MSSFEYKVVPAPVRGMKAKGVKGTQARFAHALQTVMNDLGAEGWEYQRTDTLPVEERQGLTGKTTSFQNMLVFRRTIAEAPAPVAALIEDQSDTQEAREEPADAQTEGTDVAESETSDRVTETLSAPFVFPWNKRAKNVTPFAPSTPQAEAGRADDNIPAE